MGLIDLKTDLKSLRFGKDRVGGGNSNQPYVVTPIPEGFAGVGRTGGPDFLLRGGTLLPKVVVQDVSRLTKMFFDFRSPSGPLFIAKQNLLSLTNVNSSAGYISFTDTANEWQKATANKSGNFFQRADPTIPAFLKNNVAINQGIYTPLSTIGQAAANPFGLHLNKQGLNPIAGGLQQNKSTKEFFTGNTPLGLPTYLNSIATGGVEGNKSRLLGFAPKILNDTQGVPLLYKYNGGPRATLGVGTTSIMMLGDQRTGINNAYKSQLVFNQLDNAKNIADGKIQYKGSEYLPGQNKSKNVTGTADINATPNIQLAYGASIKYFSTLSSTNQTTYLNNAQFFNANDVVVPLSPSVYQSGDGLVTNIEALRSGVGPNNVPRLVYTQEQISKKTPISKGGKIENFSEPFVGPYVPASLDYILEGGKNRIEQRVNLGDPGRRGNRSSYTVGLRGLNNTDPSVKNNSGYKNALDKINSFPLYKSSGPFSADPTQINDLVKFRIGVIDSDKPNQKTYIHFRAFIDGFSDNYSSDWSSQKYMGRGENFYKYNGFDRQISLSWTVAAQSKQELIPMHQKLNYLASVCAPDYSDAGYMRGNLISLTVGGWCYEQVGIMKGINLEIPDDSPWEIGIPDNLVEQTVNGSEVKSDRSVKELPMIIKVTGFTFIPIHDFVPRVQQNKFNNNNNDFISSFGPEHYINLAAAGTNNYGLINSGVTGSIGELNYIPVKTANSK